MSEDVSIETIKNTQKMLGKYVKKPPLTEKLLRKPPFRFLHDVITCIIRETGFLKGLYSESELISDNVKEKEAKVNFLTKLIDAVRSITGKDVKARPSKIVAGLEPTETNILLQTIARAIDKKLDSSNYINSLSTKVSQKQNGTKASSKKEKASTRTSSSNRSDSSERKAKTSTRSTPRAKNSKESLLPNKTSSKENLLSNSRTKLEEKQQKQKELKSSKPSSTKHSKSSLKVDAVETTPVEEKGSFTSLQEESTSTEEERTSLTNIVEASKLKTVPEAENENVISENQDNYKEKDTTKESEIEKKEAESEVRDEIKSEIDDVKKEKDEIKKGELKKEINAEEVKEKVSNLLRNDTPLVRPKSAKPKSGMRKERERHGTARNLQMETSSTEVSVTNETSSVSESKRPKSTLRPPSVRPSSARPGAPRLKTDTALPLDEAVPLGKVKVIVEDFDKKDLDEEETVTVQVAADLEPEVLTKSLDLPADKGRLVEQILEQLQDSDVVQDQEKAQGSQVTIEWEQEGLRGRDAAVKEIEELRAMLQELTKVANPLGKLIGYLHEDIDAMHSEMNMWLDTRKQIVQEIATQKRHSEDEQKPLLAQLESVKESIEKLKEQISFTRANILRSEERIQTLLIK